MKLEQNPKIYYLKNRDTRYIFFNEYLSIASGDFLLRFIFYMLFLSKYIKDVKSADPF